MKTVAEMLEQVQGTNLDEEIEQSLIDCQDTYKVLQQEQLLAGKRRDGKNIFRLSTGSDKYSPIYARYKGKDSPIDLFDKGDFQFDIFMDVRDKELYIDSADIKSGMLQKDYGEEIFGLSDKPASHFADQVGTVLVDRYGSKLK